MQEDLHLEAVSAFAGSLQVSISFAGPSITAHFSDLELFLQPVERQAATQACPTLHHNNEKSRGVLHSLAVYSCLFLLAINS
jgi:hypothetical protein